MSRGSKPRRAASGAATASEVELEHSLGLAFRRRALLREALTHRSFNTALPLETREPDYERLEFLGDAVLALRVSERLLRAYPEASEGRLSRLRAWLVSARHLAAGAQKCGLGRFLRLSPAEASVGGRGKERLLANAMEAVIGALYQDRGYRAAAQFIDERVLGASLEELSPEHLHEFAYKSALQEWAHAQGRPLPTYRIVGTSGPEHGKLFQIEVEIAGVYAGRASGRSKKEAEQRAAHGALVHVGAIPALPT